MKLILCMGFMVVLSSCDKTPSIPADESGPADTSAHGVFICNEGNFQWGNAGLSFYNTTSGNTVEDVFKSSNNKTLGDVLQSINLINDKAYLVINNSGKIEVINPRTFKSISVIHGFNSPRYILKVSNSKAYVSDLYEKAIWILNLNTEQISGKIPIPSWTEEMVYCNGNAFVCGKNSPFVYVVNAETDQLMDSISVGYGPQNMVLDHNQKLWVLTIGKAPILPQLHRIHPQLGIEKSFSFLQTDLPARLVLNANRSRIFWINKDIFGMSVEDQILPNSALIQAQGKNFYGLGFDPVQKQILASDAKDFVQKSEIYCFDTLGQQKTHFKAGINAGYFYAK